MNTNEQASINRSPNAHEHSSRGLAKSPTMDLNMNCDDNTKSAKTWHTLLETLFWVSAIVGWGAVAYLHHMHPSFP